MLRRHHAAWGTAATSLLAACLGEDGRFEQNATAASGGATGASTIDASASSSTASSQTASSSSATGTGGAAESFTLLHAVRYASPLEQSARALAVSGSAIYVVGALNGSITVGPDPTDSHGGSDALLFATDHDLNGLFAKAYGNDVAQTGTVAAFSPMLGNVLMAGTFAGQIPELDGATSQDEDFFAARLDENGQHVSHRYHEDARINAGAATNGGWVLAGDYDGYIDWAGDAGGKRDAFVAWTRGDFGWDFAMKVSSDEDDAARGVAQSPAGRTAMVGEIKAAAKCGNFDLAFVGATDAFVAYFDEDHDPVFARGLGDDKPQQAVDVAFDAAGNVVVVGNFEGKIDFGEGISLTSAGAKDFFVAILSPTGNTVAARSFGGAKDQTVSALAISSTGNIVLTGTYLGAPDFGSGQPLAEHDKSDVFLLVLDGALTHLTSAGFGAAGTQRGVDVALDASDRIYLLADVQEDIDFGGGPLAPLDTSFDIALAQFAP